MKHGPHQLPTAPARVRQRRNLRVTGLLAAPLVGLVVILAACGSGSGSDPGGSKSAPTSSPDRGGGLIEFLAKRCGCLRPVCPLAWRAGLSRPPERALPYQRERPEQPELPVCGPGLPEPAAWRVSHQRRRWIEQLGRARVRPLHADARRAEFPRPVQQRRPVGSPGNRRELTTVPIGVPGVQFAAAK